MDFMQYGGISIKRQGKGDTPVCHPSIYFNGKPGWFEEYIKEL